jgi:ATP-binding cassette, subfamily B, bacterial
MAHDFGLLIMAGGMLAWAIALWNRGSVTPGDVVVISALTFRILHGSRDLAMAATAMVNNIAFIRETLSTVGQDHDVADAPDATELEKRSGSIDFDQATFSYGNDTKVFENFSLHIPPGQHVGLVGPSGSGKSTMIALIQRLYDVQSGSVKVDGQDVKAVTQDSLRASIAVVPQDCVLFHRSLLENIRYARPSATEDEVIAADCHDFITAMPQGYDTVVGERGMHLSGGQRQRIAIARALLADTEIVLLDEATSALDSISEQEVQRALDELLHGRTVIIAAHRLATLAACDRVIVLDKGRIAEDGPPDHLLQQQGVFRDLWERQSMRQVMGPNLSNAAE